MPDLDHDRRRSRIAVVAVLGAIAIAGSAVACADLTGGHHPPVVGDASPSAAGSPSATSSAIAACRADQLTGAVTDQSAMASQPSVIIALTDSSASSCQLIGYPQLTAAGYAQSAPTTAHTLPVQVTNGATYERPDPGPRRIVLAPSGSASFALGTGTAYDGGANLFTITRVQVVVPGDPTAIAVTTSVAASAPAGQPIPVTVTAFVAGRMGPPK